MQQVALQRPQGRHCQRFHIVPAGTPIQNSMAELWALLHFIMPSLFDSQASFNEWFSKARDVMRVRWLL